MSSPLSTGPAGSHFESKVGAHYLLSMLVEAPARGLPGTIIDRVEMQRAPQGMHLDDVIVRAHDRSGNTAILEIQVKRTITFSPREPVFKEVVEQIGKTAAKADFLAANYQLGIATSATSRQIHGPYQDVLTWARQIGDAKTFIEQVERTGTSNDDIRSFVVTFRSHLKDAGAPHDDETVWKILRRLHILTFDFTAPESSAQELAQERCARALELSAAGRAADLWKVLTEIATEAASSAGDRDRLQLLAELSASSGQVGRRC